MIIEREVVEGIFARKGQDQGSILIDLYRLVIPTFDRIKSMKGWPKSGVELDRFISESFIAFDKKYHPEVLSGGLWLNNGWSIDSELGPWEVSMDGVSVEYNEKEV